MQTQILTRKARRMADELKDFRGKITALSWCYLEAEHRTTGADQSEIVREILHGWAMKKHQAHIEAQAILRAEGITGIAGEAEGTRGNTRERQG